MKATLTIWVSSRCSAAYSLYLRNAGSSLSNISVGKSLTLHLHTVVILNVLKLLKYCVAEYEQIL